MDKDQCDSNTSRTGQQNDNDARSSLLLPLPSPPTFVEEEAELDNDEDDGITIFFRLNIGVNFLDLLELCTAAFDNDGSADVVDAVNNTTQSASATT